MYPLNVAALNANNLKQPRRNVRGLCNTQIQLFRDRFWKVQYEIAERLKKDNKIDVSY